MIVLLSIAASAVPRDMRIGTLEITAVLLLVAVFAGRPRIRAAADVGVLTPIRVDLEIFEVGGRRRAELRTPFELGRSSETAVVLRDPEVSRRHARFDGQNGIVYVEDLKEQKRNVSERTANRRGNRDSARRRNRRRHDPIGRDRGTPRLIARVVRRAAPMVGALAVSALILHFAPPRTVGPPWMLALLAGLALLWVLWQPAAMVRDDLLPALAVVLAALGLAMVARLAPDLAQKQQLWILVSLVLAIVAAPAFTQFRRFAAYKYLWVVASLVLFALLLIFGQEVNGARLWIRLGPVQYEPIELIKLFIVFFLAAYLAETADVIASARLWSLRANIKYLGPLFVGWGASMAILVVQRDLGMATLLLATFAALLYVATRRIDIVFFGALLFALGAFWAVHHYPYVHARIAVWLNPFSDPLHAGYQSSQAYYSLASGGLVGSGYRLGHPNSFRTFGPTTSMRPLPRSLD